MILDTTKSRVIGVNVNLEKTSYAIVDVRGNIIGEGNFPTLNYPQINDFVNRLCDDILHMSEAYGGYETVRSVGVSIPSGNFITGYIENSPNLPWKGNIPLSAMMRDRLGLAVAVGNNAHARALGEQTFGSAHGIKDFILLTLGTGFGSCIISNGKPYLGNDGFAGEVGHVCVKPGGRQCGCGGKGCLETYCAEAGILRTAQELMSQSDRPSLMRDCQRLTPKVIADFCDQGDEMSIEVYRLTGQMLGLGLANYATLVNPEAIIFTGGISLAGHWLLDPTKKVFEENVFHNVRGKVKFLNSTLTDAERSMLGASALAWIVKEYSLFL